MGLFSWISKGVRVDKRVPKTQSQEAVAELNDEPFIMNVEDNQSNDNNVGEQQGMAASILFERTETQSFDNSYQNALNGQTYGNRNILIVTPKTNVEVTQIVENIKNGDACIVCLEGMDVADAQRRLDFLSGVICAQNGSIKRLNPNTYILAPSGIGVRK